MLTSWRIGNFKSVREPQDLSLRPLTVVCGPNSSGKSTLLKSILAAAQSLNSNAWQEPLVLNGRFVQLGTVDEVLHHGAEDKSIPLDFTVQTPSGSQVRVTASLKVEEEKSHGGLRKRLGVVESVISSNDGEESEELIVLRRREVPLTARERPQAVSPELEAQIERGLFDYQIMQPGPEELTGGQWFVESVAACLRNFLPGQVLVATRPRIRQATQRVVQLANVILAVAEGYNLPRGTYLDQPVTEEAREAFAQAAAYAYVDHDLAAQIVRLAGGEDEEVTLGEFMRRIDALRRDDEVAALAQSLRGGVSRMQRRRESTESSRGPKVLELMDFPAHPDSLREEVMKSLGQRVAYLGPLREDPRAIYAIPEIPGQRDVGVKGQYTAAMLELYGRELVTYPMPPQTPSTSGFPPQHRQAPLEEAVENWLVYLDMAETLTTKETAKVGFSLNVRTPELDQELDLMSVGVGVSQVLPTVVMALLAPEHSLLIFEQPEVHLHPRVQSALADFFLGIAGCGKQCIVETHSEHLINRLRLRVVEDYSSQVLEQLRLYFVERQRAASTFRLVQPNAYGVIGEWPLGFFDETPNEASKLLQAQSARRRATLKELSSAEPTGVEA